MTKSIAKILSFLFHPLFLLSYLMLILIIVNPYLFSIHDAKSLGLVVISVVALSVGFPLITIIMLRLLDFISSFEMQNPMERIGPLIATGLFYLWLFVNIKNNAIIPAAFTIMVLGTTIALFLAFFINNFSKISLHTVGMGGFVAAIFILRFFYSYDFFILDLSSLGTYKIHINVLLILSVLIAGLIGSCRLFLGAHKNIDIYGGYMVGIFAQLLAFRILF